MATVLAVDDDAAILGLLENVLRRSAHRVTCASCAGEAVERCRLHPFDLALIDFKLPDLDGIDLFTQIRSERCSRGLLLTGHLLDSADADRALQAGLMGLISKPIRLSFLESRISQVLGSGLSQESDVGPDGDSPVAPSEPPMPQGDFDGMIGETVVMRRVFKTIARCAPQGAPVLITGATGTGKELVAKSIHRRSARASCPLVAVNCAAVPVTLFESEFFGHERGAFTGAERSRQGWFELANGGTLFLDEIGDLPLEAQGKILRAVESKEVTPIGARHARHVDVRIVAATNGDLGAAVAKRAFRSDLYWRLNAVSIHLPPLTQRRADIPLLVRHLLASIRSELKAPGAALSRGAVSYLAARDWPGNVRELAQVLRRIILDADQFPVTADEVSRALENGAFGVEAGALEPERRVSLPARLAEVRRRLESSWILLALKEARGHHSRAAHALGINRKTLYEKMERYGLRGEITRED